MSCKRVFAVRMAMRVPEAKPVSFSWIEAPMFQMPRGTARRVDAICNNTGQGRALRRSRGEKHLCLKLKVKRERSITACKELLDTLPVQDIDIQEVPIEEIIRKIFARGNRNRRFPALDKTK